MNGKAIVEHLRNLADNLESESTETVKYLGEDGNVHEVPVCVRVAHLPKLTKTEGASINPVYWL